MNTSSAAPSQSPAGSGAGALFGYVLKRVLLMIPTILGAGVVVFFIMRVIPLDACEVKWADYAMHYTLDVIGPCREELGLNDPWLVQFARFIIGFFTLDFGASMYTGVPVIHEIELRFALSLQLAVMATLVSVAIAIPLGVISALNQNTWIDYTVRLFSIAGLAVPAFFMGTLIILGLLEFTRAWSGNSWMPPIVYVPFFEDPLANMTQMIWPVLAVGYRYAAVTARMTRSALLEVINEEYIRTARAKGLPEKIVINRHALGNAFLPVVTIIGSEFAFLIGNLVVTEYVFNLNGIGVLLFESVLNADYTVTQSLVMLLVTIFVVINFLIDLVYVWLDPRIRYS